MQDSSAAEPIRYLALRRLWERMAAIYGHKWTSTYGDACEDGKGDLTLPGDTWRKGLAGIPEPSIAAGLSACIAAADPWPPTLPQFRAMCLGIPSFAVLRSEIAAGESNWTPFARLAWSFIRSFDYKLAPIDKAARMLREAYEQAREHVMRGGALPEPPAGLIEAPKEEERTPANPETVRAAKEAILGADPDPEAAIVETVRAACPDLEALLGDAS